MAPLITRAVLTQQMTGIDGVVREALTALLAELAPKFGAALRLGRAMAPGGETVQ